MKTQLFSIVLTVILLSCADNTSVNEPDVKEEQNSSNNDGVISCEPNRWLGEYMVISWSEKDLPPHNGHDVIIINESKFIIKDRRREKGKEYEIVSFIEENNTFNLKRLNDDGIEEHEKFALFSFNSEQEGVYTLGKRELVFKLMKQ